jgi:hypothetical protein
MSRFILALLRGEHWEELLRPDALRYNMGSGNGGGHVIWDAEGAEQAVAAWDIELDPATWQDHGYPGPQIPHYIRFTSSPIAPEWFPPTQEAYIELPCTERTRFTGTFPDFAELPRDITLEFFCSSSEAHPIVIWYMGIDNAETPTQILNFLPA